MNKRIITIIFSLGFIGCFFLPYLQEAGRTASGFEIVTAPLTPGLGKGLLIMKYIWLLIPVAGLILLIGALNNENYFFGRFIWAAVPLAVFFAFLAKIYMDGKKVEQIPAVKDIANMIGLGLWITLGLSLILVILSFGKKR